MPDDVVGIILVLLQKIVHPREGYLVDVLVYLLIGHADTAVRDGDGALVLVQADVNGQVAQLALELALLGQRLQLLRGVDGIADHLAQEYLVV